MKKTYKKPQAQIDYLDCYLNTVSASVNDYKNGNDINVGDSDDETPKGNNGIWNN